ncbi:MAG: SOS response-associated peptidase family protein [Lachnospiraceae bacterium]|nr:SOS response-associated peptidase family protein [Lachnospiraceae bacterium]
MCGRYYVDDGTFREIERLVREIDARSLHSGGRVESTDEKTIGQITSIEGDVYPSQEAVVLSGKGQNLMIERMRWGFVQQERKNLLINARVETVLERNMFRDSVMHRRCVVPARHFYEWDASKNKVSFMRRDDSILYMAGFYRQFQGEDRFVILTTESNTSVASVHERMPLILEAPEVEDWIFEDTCLDSLLHKKPIQLAKSQEYKQMSLFDL